MTIRLSQFEQSVLLQHNSQASYYGVHFHYCNNNFNCVDNCCCIY